MAPGDSLTRAVKFIFGFYFCFAGLFAIICLSNSYHPFMKKKAEIKKKAVKKSVVVAVSGYFNPLHVGHLEMIRKAKKLGNELVAIVNNDIQVALKGSVPFVSLSDRVEIVKALRDVDRVFISLDKDKTVCKSLIKVRPDIFANGGDRHSVGDVPEYPICQKYGIKMVDGLGRKIRASSQLIAKAAALKAQKIETGRPSK